MILSYLRVSGQSQVDQGGIPRQREAVALYARRNQLVIDHEFRDEAVSGTKKGEDRPQMAAMMDLLSENKGEHTLLIESSSRLARSLLISERIVAEMEKLGCKIVDCSTGMCINDEPEDSTRRLIRQIMAAFAEFEKSVLVHRMKRGRERKRKIAGWCEGPKRGMAALEARVLELEAQGYKVAEMAAILADVMPPKLKLVKGGYEECAEKVANPKQRISDILHRHRNGKRAGNSMG